MQLYSLLSSLIHPTHTTHHTANHSVATYDATNHNDNIGHTIHVITPTYYPTVSSAFPSVNHHLETSSNPFHTILRSLLSIPSTHVMFLVDDALFVSTPPLASSCDLLNSDPTLLAVHLKLHPGIWYSHPASTPCPPPPLHLESKGFLSWTYSQGRVDYNYPFDLCSTIYRSRDALSIISSLSDISASHPNRLEPAGNKALGGLALGSRGAMPRVKTAVVVTLNRVQDVHSAPLYGEVPVEELAAELARGRILDPQAFAKGVALSAHVGGLHLKPIGACPKPPDTLPPFSVLLPVKVGPPSAAQVAARSLVEAYLGIHEPRPSWQVVVVDDGCTDGSVDAIVEALEGSPNVTVTVVDGPGSGLAAALNEGLGACEHEVVVRMDADDVCEPTRFGESIPLLGGGVKVVGTSIAIFKGDGKPKSPFKLSINPPDRHFLAYAFCFSDPVAHPSTIFLKSAVVEAGGYSSSYTAAEDYELWTRLVPHVTNLSSVQLLHRKWGGNTSTTSRVVQRMNAKAVAKKYVESMIGEIDEEALEALRHPGPHYTGSAGALSLLLRIEAFFVDRYPPLAAELVRNDVTSRLIQLATHAPTPSLLSEWEKRRPQDKIERALLLAMSSI